MSSADKSSKLKLEDVEKKLAEKGIDPTCTADEKISHLWNLYLKSEASLQASLQNISELRKQQTEEMREVEIYVEHIRSLSDEREALTLEFEAENEQLKGQIKEMKLELEGYKNEESSDMLLQQGLDDIAYGTTSEQIAYLLVERARLMDELEAEQGGNMIDTPEGPLTAQQIYGILQQERHEFEVELSQQRESLSSAKENLRVDLEDEMTAIMEENEKLQNMLTESRQKVQKLQEELESSEERLGKTGKDSGDLSGEAEKRLKQLQERVDEVEADNQTLVDNVQSLTIELQEEKTKANKALIDWEKKEQDLEVQLDQTTASLRKLESEKERLTSEKDLAQRQVSDMKAERDEKSTSKNAIIESEGVSSAHLRSEIDRLKEDKRTLQDSLAEIKASLQSEKDNSFELNLKLKRANSDLKNHKSSAELQEQQDRSKIDQLNQEVKRIKEELDKYTYDLKEAHNKGRQGENMQTDLRNQMQQLRQEMLSHKQNCDTLEQRLKDSQEETRTAQAKIQEMKDSRQDMKQSLQEEKEEIMNKLLNSEMTTKETEEQLKRERIKNQENMEASAKRLEKVTNDLDDLRMENVRVSTELSKTQEELDMYRTQSEQDKEKAEQIIQSLRTDLIMAQKGDNAEKDSLSSRLEQIYQENRELRSKYSRKEEELARQRIDYEKSKIVEDQVNYQYDAEKRHRSDLEQRNKVLEDEARKACGKLKESMEKLSKLELENDRLEDELRRKNRQVRESEETFNHRSIEQQTQLKLAQSRTESAEKKLFELQNDLEEALSRLQTAEQQVKELSQVRFQLDHRQEEVNTLQTQLQEERVQRTVQNHGSDEVQQQLVAYRDRERDLQRRNNDLQRMLLEVESKVQSMKDQTQSNTESRLTVEKTQRHMTDQMDQMQKDMDILQTQLFSVSEKYDAQVRKYAERKIRTQNKLHKAREIFNAEKYRLKSDCDRLQNELSLAKAELESERRQRATVEAGHHKLVLENRELMSRIAEFEEAIRDQNRKVSILQVRTKFLEDENNTLQQRVDSLTRQKHNLDRIVKEYQMERQREEVRWKITSHTNTILSPRSYNPTLNLASELSLDTKEISSNFENRNILEALISPRVKSPVDEGSLNLSQTLPNPSSTNGQTQNGILDLEDASLPPPINHDTFPTQRETDNNSFHLNLERNNLDQQETEQTEQLFTSVNHEEHQRANDNNTRSNSSYVYEEETEDPIYENTQDDDEHTYENSELRRNVQQALGDTEFNSFEDSDFDDDESNDSIIEL